MRHSEVSMIEAKPNPIIIIIIIINIIYYL